MSDLISASALLLTAVTLMYTVWYCEIHDAQLTPFPPGGPLNATDAISNVRRVLFTRALPLTAVAVAEAVIFSKPAIEIAARGVPLFIGDPGNSWNAVAASLVVIWFFTVVLMLGLIVESWRLNDRASKLGNPASYG